MIHRKLKNSELERKTVTEFKTASKTPLTLVLDNIRSANNIGSVFRTADAFLIKKIVLCGVCATPPHKNIRKTALGATATVQWEYAADTLTAVKNLKEDKVKVMAVEQAEKATMLHDFQPQPQTEYAIVLGNEVKGVQQKVISASDGVLEIPQLGHKHSLNIAVSAGIVCWDVFAKLTKL